MRKYLFSTIAAVLAVFLTTFSMPAHSGNKKTKVLLFFQYLGTSEIGYTEAANWRMSLMIPWGLSCQGGDLPCSIAVEGLGIFDVTDLVNRISIEGPEFFCSSFVSILDYKTSQ